MRLLLAAVALLALAAVILVVSCTARTPPIRDGDGTPVGGSIATLEPVAIGGAEQWVPIRGRDAADPVLLWLHGGPGASEMPVVPHYNRGLEDHVVVVHWDQRGAGKSNPKDSDESTMTFERFVQDGREVTAYLKERFQREQIYLLGHSWGAHLGLVLADRYPEDYWAYIGVSQHVSAARSHPVAHEWIERRIREAGDEGDPRRSAPSVRPPTVTTRRWWTSSIWSMPTEATSMWG